MTKGEAGDVTAHYKRELWEFIAVTALMLLQIQTLREGCQSWTGWIY